MPLLSMRLLMGWFLGCVTRRTMGLLVVMEVHSIIVVLVVVHWCALLKGMGMLKRCQTRWFIMLTV